jgi:hypothetical protein
MTGPTATLRFAATEITTDDELVVATLWRLLAHSVTPAERAAVAGRSEFQQPTRPPVRLVAIEGGE